MDQNLFICKYNFICRKSYFSPSNCLYTLSKEIVRLSVSLSLDTLLCSTDIFVHLCHGIYSLNDCYFLISQFVNIYWDFDWDYEKSAKSVGIVNVLTIFFVLTLRISPCIMSSFFNMFSNGLYILVYRSFTTFIIFILNYLEFSCSFKQYSFPFKLLTFYY